MIRQLLAESEVEVTAWREKLLAALGPNDQVIIKVIPEVELITGPQPKAPELGPAEAENRFNLTFQNFIQVFTRPEHPLVIFVDDLQWADRASLKLMARLMTTPDSQYLCLIGAYRDNEVSGGHPLLLALDEIEQAGAALEHISLSPLTLPHVTQFVADTLHSPPEQVSPLAELVLAKTDGNPFFINEFLQTLYQEKLIEFVYPASTDALEDQSATPPGARKRRASIRNPQSAIGWRWDLAQIRERDITDNVVELMAGKVKKLPPETQTVLKLAACMGNQFDLKTLAVVNEKPPAETAAVLWPALTAGRLLPLGDAYKYVDSSVVSRQSSLVDDNMPAQPQTSVATDKRQLTTDKEQLAIDYKFTHDRVQQAVYSLITEEDRQAIHWRVGQLLLHATRIAPNEREEHIFDLVNQLNRGRALIEQPAERIELAELNLLAGRKAKAAAAYEPALNYLQVGLDMLTAVEDRWAQRYDLTLALYEEATEAAYLSGDFEQMEQLAEVVLQQAKTVLDKVRVYEVKIQARIVHHKPVEAIKTALPVLKLLGVRFPNKPGNLHILFALLQTKFTLAGKRIEDLGNLPEMTDPYRLTATRILNRITSATYLAAPELMPLVVFKGVNLSLKYGNSPVSAPAYTTYGAILCGVVGDIEAGYRFGQLALNLLERFQAKELKAITIFAVNAFIKHWKKHTRETLQPFMEGYQSGLETGDLEFAAWCIKDYSMGACICWGGANLVAYPPPCGALKRPADTAKPVKTG